MVGCRDPQMFHCGLCSDAFTSKVALNQHMAVHKEPETPQWPCLMCPFKFNDSYALEAHKDQTGHSDVQYICDKCGRVFQTQAKFKQHSQFPSPCYADASRTRPVRNTSMNQAREAPAGTSNQTYGRAGYVDLDTPVAVEVPVVLPYSNSADPITRSATPSNQSDSGIYCHDCKRSFASLALYNRHCLSCAVQNRPMANPNTTASATCHTQVPPARSSAGVARPAPLPLASHKATSNSTSLIACQLDGCGRSFQSQDALVQHRRDSHNQTVSHSNLVCGVDGCGRYFQSQDALEQHQRDSHKSVVHNDLFCGVDGCGSKFQSQQALDQHTRANHILLCDVGGCGKPFQLKAELLDHKKNSHTVGNQGPTTQPRQARPAPSTSAPPVQAVHPTPTASALSVQDMRTQTSAGSSSGGTTLNAANVSLICGINNCPRSFRSEAGLKQHKIDSHGLGGRVLDIHGKDSWMLPQNVRNQLRDAGVYRSPGPAPQQTRGGLRAAPAPAVSVPGHFQGPSAGQQLLRNPVRAPMPAANASAGPDIGGPLEIDQANELQGKIMRMLITADIAIRHDGKIVYDGVAWTRIGVVKQDAVVCMIDELVHLRKLSRSGQARQHVSHPTTFKADFVGDYPSPDFEQLPEPRDGSLRVVVLCCSKVLLENRREEAVKMAAVDVLTGRPLMTYLVCTGSTEKVRDWRTTLTGLSSFHDFEAARAQRFKILKGWTAARTALGKFVDQNTILVGYNLRSDLDALRIRHGRCVDLIKLVEKAAEGSLSRRQLRLEHLLRDLPEITYQTGPFGRDCLQDAFAMRELALWYLKQKDKFVRYAKEKAREIQRSGI